MLDAKGGEGSSMLDLGGALYARSRGSLFITFGFLMCDTLLCIHVYFHALNYIRVIVIFM